MTNTMRVQINRLRQALGDTASRPRYLETLIGVGYRLDDLVRRDLHVTETLYRGSYSIAESDRGQRKRRDAMSGAPKLLIVDDAADICQLPMVYYAGRGYGVWVAYDGGSAQGLAVRDQPDLILLDLGPPDIDGLEACRRSHAVNGVILSI
ncbi:winged helix-turn-helix domain-containing protein [Oscillochloris sp. ZM17-4]|uniref:winged helix-turn-helix domain-containing protein n=1 Tax=Oscillochloris sp. ZM17-4 TaxID=2866714 RepID=UPI00272E590B|nr:winged helix-turn-helix domain-containing protein [Oscillochloris sp. ZM17-4]